jgi:hypothetical protein
MLHFRISLMDRETKSNTYPHAAGPIRRPESGEQTWVLVGMFARQPTNSPGTFGIGAERRDNRLAGYRRRAPSISQSVRSFTASQLKTRPPRPLTQYITAVIS